MGALAVATTAAGSKSNGGFGLIIWIVLIVLVIFYMTTVRRRRAAAQQGGQTVLEVGSRCVTIGGLHGTVAAVDGSDVLLEVAPDVVLRFERRAIAKIEPPEHDHELGPAHEEISAADADEVDGPTAAGPEADGPTAVGPETDGPETDGPDPDDHETAEHNEPTVGGGDSPPAPKTL